MKATLYFPGQPAQQVAVDGLALPSATGQAMVSEKVANYLGCAVGMVDVLDCGPDYVAYSIFDFEGSNNRAAMVALEELSGHHYNVEYEDQMLQGPILIVAQR